MKSFVHLFIKSPSSRIVHVMSNGCMTPSVNREPVFASTDIHFRLKNIGDDKLSNLYQLGEDNIVGQSNLRDP